MKTGVILSLMGLLSGCLLPSAENIQMSARIPPPSTSGRPRSLTNIINLLQTGVRAKPLLLHADADCIDFVVVDSVEQRLRDVGADDEVIQGLRSICVDFSSNQVERKVREQLETSMGPIEAARHYSQTAAAYMERKEYGPAEGEIREALRLAPHNAEYISKLGTALAMERKCESAKQAFVALLQVETGYRYWAHYVSGICYQNTNRRHDAAIEYELALQAAWNDNQRILIRNLLTQVSANSRD